MSESSVIRATLVILAAATLVVTGCGVDHSAQMCMQYAQLPTCVLTPAPATESLLAKYKRTQADYERCSQLRDQVIASTESPDTWPIVMAAYEAMADTEKEMRNATCSRVCALADQP